jgi:hypothetical protein
MLVTRYQIEAESDRGAVVSLAGNQLAGVIIPPGCEGTVLRFAMSACCDGHPAGIYKRDGSGLYELPLSAAGFVPVDPEIFRAVPRVQLILDQAQQTQRVFQLLAVWGGLL